MSSVTFSMRVASFEQHDDRVEVDIETAKGAQRLTASYLIGCDGGRSSVRKAMGIEFEGYTHPERFLVLTTTFAFDAEYAQCSRNYSSIPKSGARCSRSPEMTAKVCGEYCSQPDSTKLTSRPWPRRPFRAGYRSFFPRPAPIQWSIATSITFINASPYRSEKAEYFLPGTAAHINNPLGGLGLNFGIHDAMELTDLLGRVIRDEAAGRLLDDYDRFRRPPTSSTSSNRPSPTRSDWKRRIPRHAPKATRCYVLPPLTLKNIAHTC